MARELANFRTDAEEALKKYKDDPTPVNKAAARTALKDLQKLDTTVAQEVADADNFPFFATINPEYALKDAVEKYKKDLEGYEIRTNYNDFFLDYVTTINEEERAEVKKTFTQWPDLAKAYEAVCDENPPSAT